MTLESPGGVIDPGEDPKRAALRELEEETGYTCDNIISLGVTNPNPAFINNKLYMFLALDCYQPENRVHFPDKNESIKICELPMGDLEDLIEKGGIQNALSLLTAYKSLLYVMRNNELNA